MADEADETAPPRVFVDGSTRSMSRCCAAAGARDGGARGREQLARAGFDDRSAEIWVVFDGPHPANEAEAGAALGGPRIAFAHSADAWLLQRVRESRAGEVAVVTADRPLAARARARGARVVSPRDFLARCGGASKDLTRDVAGLHRARKRLARQPARRFATARSAIRARGDRRAADGGQHHVREPQKRLAGGSAPFESRAPRRQ
jgi:hypothetical protein